MADIANAIPTAKDELIPDGTEHVDLNSADNLDAASALDALMTAATDSKQDEASPEKPAEKAAEKPAEKTNSQPSGETNVDHPIDPKPDEKKDEGKAQEDFEKIELPPYTKPKAAEAFATVKEQARQRIAAIAKERDEIKAALKAAEEKAAAAPAPESVKELEELRAFRQRMDVEADPSFKDFDAKITANADAIYSKLAANGIKPDVIEKIKSLGGPENVDWDAVAAKFPSALKRYIEGKVFENEDLADKKKQAIEKAKANAKEFVATREKELQGKGESFRKDVKKEADGLLAQLPWFKPQVATDKSTPEEKAAIDAHNKMLATAQASVKEAMEDDSPSTRAILVAGFAQLLKARADLASRDAVHKAALDKVNAEHEATKKELAAKVALLEKVKKSSGALKSGAPTDGKPTTAKIDIHSDSGSSLDRLKAEYEAANA